MKKIDYLDEVNHSTATVVIILVRLYGFQELSIDYSAYELHVYTKIKYYIWNFHGKIRN
jgi:hypothetical protein